MSSTPKAIVEPLVLTWARESAGFALDAAANRIGVRPVRVHDWETGEDAPTLNQLRKLAQVYKRPLAVFFLPEPPRGFDTLRDFRLLPDTGDGPWSPELRFAVRKAQEQQRTAVELIEMMGDDLPRLENLSHRAQDAEAFGADVRSALGIPLSDQLGWGTSKAAFRVWANAIERLGVFVMQSRGVDTSEMRGFSLLEPVPAVVVNGSDANNGKIFTLIHELAHLYLHETGLCDTKERAETHSQDAAIESFCNRVAAAVLMPIEVFRQRAVAYALAGDDWDESAIEELSSAFSVSREAVVRRLLTLNLTTREFYEAKRKQYGDEYRDRKAQEKDAAKGNEAPIYYPMKVSELGHAFIETALEGHAQGLISHLELADALEVKVRNVDKLVKELRRRKSGAA